MDYNSLIQDSIEDTRSSMKDWVTKTFFRRECMRFVRSKNNKCGCGRYYEEHHKMLRHTFRQTNQECMKTINEDQKPWRIQDNTELFPTNAFGTLEFQGADIHTTKAEYMRISFDTNPQNIIKLMKNYWQLELPKLIISVHGGIANFGLQPKLKQALRKGLIKVVNTSHIWIITAGTDTGVVKHIGDILKEILPNSRQNIIAIGIAPWGVVNEKDSLIGSSIEVPYYANQRTVNSGHFFNLNNCHSYFLLVDDGTVGKYGCEISFRRRVERFLSRHKSEIFVDFDLKPKIMDVTIEEKITLQNHHTIPLVCLIVEGGTNTIQTVLVNVHDKPPVPVVVCDGSGRAADLIAFSHKYATVNTVTEKASMEFEVREQLISTIMKTFAYNRSQADYIYIQLINCVKKRDLISIYRLGDYEKQNQEIDLAILAASLKVIDLQLNKQLDIIMSWNRPDVAKKYILLNGSEPEKKVLEDKMFEALSQDKVDFVQLFLEYGVNLQKFLTFKRIQDLYNCKKGPTATLIYIVRDVVKKMDSNHRITLPDIGLVVEKLISNGYVSEYSSREFRAKYNRLNTKKHQSLSSASREKTEINDFVFKSPYNELLVWAVLMKRHKMAMFVCKRGEETLAMALVAAKLNKSLAREAELDDLDSEISDEYKKYAEEFSALALGLLDKCYKEDDELTSQLLTYDLVNWSHWTCLSLAYSLNHKDFLSHPACQMLINDLWMGGMKIRKYVTYKIIFALLFPPAIFAIQFKSAKELQYMPQTQEEHEQDLESHDEASHTINDHNTDIGLTLNGLNARNENSDSVDGSDPNLVERVLEYDQSKATRNSKMLSLDQIIEFYDEHQMNGNTGKFVLDENKINENVRQIEKKRKLATQHRTNKLKIGKKIYEFYNAPITKFWQHTLMYILFLVCFSYIVLVRTPPEPSILEIFFLVYVFCYGLDKIRDLLQTDSPRFTSKIKIFFSNSKNSLDVIFILSIIVALGFRLSPFTENQKVARLIYCVNTIYWYVKLLDFLIINKYTGPLIIIASRMLIDLLNFIVILLIVLMSFGLSRQAIKFPNEDFNWSLVKMIFLEPYFMLYGEVYAPDIDPPCNMTTDPHAPGCQYGHWITPLTMTSFMIIANLLFLTILIASFNNTYMRISRQSAQFWKCRRYDFVTSYEAKPLLAPPFVVISHIYLVIKYFIRLCQRKTIKFDRKLKAFLSQEMMQRLNDFEDDCFYQYNCDLERSKNNSPEQKINHTSDKVDNISDRIDDILFKENMTKSSLYKVELRIQKLEEIAFEAIAQMKNLSKAIRLNQHLTSDIKQPTSGAEMQSAMNSKLSQIRYLRTRSNTISSDQNLENKKSSTLKLFQQKPSVSFKEDYDGGSLSNLRKRQNKSESKESNEKSEQYPDKIFHVTSDEIVNLEQDYLKKYSKKTYEDNRSCSSSDSDLSPSKSNTKEIILDSLKKIDIIEQKMLKALDDDNEDIDTEDILNELYETSNEKKALGPQVSHGLDQHNVHPFVYLNSVVKPPMNEYTSITDCIDTINIDRPPSPKLFNESMKPKTLTSNKENLSSNLVNINDFSSEHSERNLLAREESEILRLAEESQHVIISQLVNKIVKTSSIEETSENEEDHGLVINDQKLREEKDRNIFADAFSEEAKTLRNQIQSDQICSIILSEENELQEFNKQEFSGKNKLTATNLIPLDPMDRKSSQIFYAQNQANLLCEDLSEAVKKSNQKKQDSNC